jgi:antibiotic biosynthesis monooxygenase (ABM) superfamily enzyme
MRVLCYLRMEIDPDRIDAYEEDLEEMIRLARKTPGFRGWKSSGGKSGVTAKASSVAVTPGCTECVTNF